MNFHLTVFENTKWHLISVFLVLFTEFTLGPRLCKLNGHYQVLVMKNIQEYTVV